MTEINGIAQPSEKPNLALVMLGYGKSAGFYISRTHPDIAKIVMTDHPVDTNKFAGLWGNHPYEQTNDVATLQRFIESVESNTPIVFIVTTNPEKGKEWLDKIFDEITNKDLIKLLKDKRPIFFLPQSPNPFIADFARHGRVIVGDYYMGIGGMSHDLSTHTSQTAAGVKEGIRYVTIPHNSEVSAAISQIIPYLTFHQPRTQDSSPLQLALLPTNALLHSVGIACHIAEALVQKNVINASVFSATTTQDFFEHFKNLDNQTILGAIGDSLKGRGFYRHMPSIGPNVLMDEVSGLVTKIRQKLIDTGFINFSDIDAPLPDDRTGAHIFHHLTGKYSQQFIQKTGNDAKQVSFGEFINTNPPYQNPQIVFPTCADGTTNTQHRFFTEEIPTLLMIYKLGAALQFSEKDLNALKLTIEFTQQLAGKEYLSADGSLGKDAPNYMRDLRTPSNFIDFSNGISR